MRKKHIPKIILITGCSSGFGLLIASRLASQGHKVLATMRDLDKKDPLLNEVHKRGAEIEIMPLDVTRPQMIKNLVVDIGNRYGHIDILINNAGYGIGGFFEDLTDEEFREQMETNFFGVLNVTREILPLMRPRQTGKIINISSVSGFSAFPCFGAYNASKWALEGFSESLRYELKPFGIEVLLIEPGTYKTKIFYENARHAKRFFDTASPYYEDSILLKDRIDRNLEDCFKDPEEVAILVEKLINAHHPSFRSIPDIEGKALFIMRKILPFSVFSFFIQKSIQKSKKINLQ